MRIFGVKSDGEFVEYQEQQFKAQHSESLIEDWIGKNPAAILENGVGLLIIGRQVTTDAGGFIDLLGVDPAGDLAVIELKRDRTPRTVIAQALEYAAFVARLDYEQIENLYRDYIGDELVSLAEAQRAHFRLSNEDAVSFNKAQRIVIVASELSSTVRETALYLRLFGVRMTCLEFGFFETGGNEQLLSLDIVVGEEISVSQPGTTRAARDTDRATFLASCDDAGRFIHGAVLALADHQGLPIHWGSRGYSVNLDIGGTHVMLCYGYPTPDRPGQAAQSLNTGFGEVARKIRHMDAALEAIREQFLSTGLFKPKGSKRDVGYRIGAIPTTEQRDLIIQLLGRLAQAITAASQDPEPQEA